MIFDHTTIQVRSTGYGRAGIGRSSWKGLTRDATRRLRFVVHAAVWLHSMVLHGRQALQLPHLDLLLLCQELTTSSSRKRKVTHCCLVQLMITDPSNYRPISLTCICCKIMENIMLSHIAKHIAKNNIIINEQHGVRNKLSTITQVINTSTDWANTPSNKGQTDIIFLDFSRAFNKISHRFILSNLHFYGIRNHTLSWIGAFLSNRTKTTVVNGVHSSYVEVTSGVPQGSVLGPMLFRLYMDDMNNAITSQIKLFTDYSVLCRNIHNQTDQVILQNDLDTISSWAEKWLMELNINKCSVLSITLKRNSIFHDHNILGAMLKRVTNHDYLGVTISSDLNRLRQVKNSNKASRTLGLLKRTLPPCSQTVKSIAYKMLVRPQLEYASEVWSPYTMKCIQKTEQIQRNSSFMNTVETLTPLFSLTG